MKALASFPVSGTTHLDVECRLEATNVDWNNIRNIYKDVKDGHAFDKGDYSIRTLEALAFFKKKRFWLNYSFMKLQQSLKDNLAKDPGLSLSVELVDSCIDDAKSWILGASPIEWDGMLACYKHCVCLYPIGEALDEAMSLYNSLL